MFQDHLDRRATREQRIEALADADQVAHLRAEPGHTRGLATVFGQVRVTRTCPNTVARPRVWPGSALRWATWSASASASIRCSRVARRQHERAEPEISWAPRDEHQRIDHELAQANRVLGTAEMIYAKIEQTLNQALDLLSRCDEVYRLGGPQIRRWANQCFFEKLLISDGEVVAAVLREPWATLVAEDFQARMARNTANPDHDSFGRGSDMMTLVPPAGFEPAAHGLGNRCSIP